MKNNVVYLADWRKKHATDEDVDDTFRRACQISDEDEASSRAKELYEMVIELRPEHTGAWNNLGNLYYAKGDDIKALACWKKAIKIDPLISDARYNMAYLLHRKSKFLEAITEYVLALDLDPTFADAHYNVADAYTSLGNYERAYQHYEKFLELTPPGEFTRQAKANMRNLKRAIREEKREN